MSALDNHIALFPPEHLVPGNTQETFFGNLQECPYCKGKGFFEDKKSTRDIYIKQTCSICQGCGNIRPIITIKWEGINISKIENLHNPNYTT